MKVLLCEDERDLANGLSIILKKNNYNVDVTYDGEEALDFINVYTYDVIVLDIMMPKIDGLTFLKTIRDKKNNTPVIIMSAMSEVGDIVGALDLGANDYLTKPFASAELLARIRVLTRNYDVTYNSLLTFGDLTLNRVTYEISTESKKEKLANKEYQLLELLMSSTTYIRTEQLMERIWDNETESEINVVWSYISILRNKLKKLNSNVKISVSRKLGYYLETTDGK